MESSSTDDSRLRGALPARDLEPVPRKTQLIPVDSAPNGEVLAIAPALCFTKTMSFVDKPADTARSGLAQIAGRKVTNLALQGGGSHGAFTWGVLDRLLEEKRLDFEGVTATSAGAVNAVVLADGLAAGGREAARDALRLFWQKVSALTSRSIFQPSAIDRANPKYGLEHSPGYLFMELWTYFASPYQMN